MHRSPLLLAALLPTLAVSHLACGARENPVQREVVTLAPAAATPAPVDYAAIVAGLRATGFAVEEMPLDSAQPFFTPRGRVLRIDGEQVVIFAYPDAAAAVADTHGITSDGFSKDTGTSGLHADWIARPHFYRRDAVVVQYIGDSVALIGQLTSLLGPQFAGQ